MDIISLIIFLAVGALAGWLAGNIVKGSGLGLVANIIVGIIGAVLGGFLFGLLGITKGGLIDSIIWPPLALLFCYISSASLRKPDLF